MRPRFLHPTQFVWHGCCLSLWFLGLFIDDLDKIITQAEKMHMVFQWIILRYGSYYWLIIRQTLSLTIGAQQEE
jgi:hypothetical protein